MDTSPVRGRDVRVRVGPEPVDAGDLVDAVADPAAGATCCFLGTVRNHAPGREGVTHLEYEAYGETVEGVIAGIVDEAVGRWPILRAVVEHRVGSLDVGEASVGVAVSSAHRADAFEAARYLIDELKRRAPIWKKEHWPGGAEWVREDLEHR
ncbi:MAG: molybdenum cofactor biosynthesis protein MoaE [Acidimicrobiia bacterium]|nr:molybdenum cofactor biosynthesis protein MoaE [Acidimicrobiia bacterium]